MAKIYYPAVFHEALDVGGFWVEYPDLPGCFSQGKTIEETIENSKEALGLFLETDEDLYQRTFSNPSQIQDVMKLFPNEIVVFIEYDPIYYARKYKTKAIKKTLTIPEFPSDSPETRPTASRTCRNALFQSGFSQAHCASWLSIQPNMSLF